MFVHDAELRVRYGETDRMGYVYYGFYAQFFEVGRVEAMRALGFPYKALEDRGVMLPVADLTIKYIKPAVYDDLLIVRTSIPELPGVKIRFDYELIRSGDGVLLTKGSTTLVFVDAKSGKPIRCPQDMLEAMEPYFPPQ
jgi:acyl-CoA thioester hydrolase